MAELVDHVTEREVVGSEVVPPGGDAMRLVDRDQAGPQRLDGGDALARSELLRRDEQQPGVAGADRVECGGALIGRLRRTHLHRTQFTYTAFVQRLDLIVLQG